jgi:hypothetical protein
MSITKILFKLSAIAAMFVLSSGVGGAIGFDPLAFGAITTTVGTALQTMASSSLFAAVGGIDIADLVTEYSAYYKGDPNRRKRLMDKLYNTGNDFDAEFITVPTDNTREEFAYSENSSVLQPYQVAWTKKGDTTILPNVATLFWAKMDIEYIPDYLVQTWAGFLRDNNLDVSQCPFIQYALENHIIPMSKQDWYLSVAWGGVYAAPTPGTAGAASTTANGVRKLIRDHNTAGAYTPFTMGALPTDPVLFCEYVEDMTAQLPEQHRKRGLKWRMSEESRLLYLEGFNELHNKFWKNSDATPDEIPVFQYQNVKVKGFENMNGSDMIWTAPRENSLLMQKGSAKKEIFKVETLKRSAFLFTDFHQGYFFTKPNEIWSNDQDLS